MGVESELKNKYAEFKGRRYVIALKDNPNNIPLIAAEAAFIADFMITSRKKLNKELQESLEYQKKEKSYLPLIDLNKKYRVYVIEDDETTHIRYRRLDKLNLDDLINTITKKIKTITGTKNLYYKSGNEFFITESKEKTSYSPHAGGIVLTAKVRPKSDGRKKGKYLISIEGPFEDSKIIFNDINSGSDDFFYTEIKGGYTRGQLLTTDVQALLLYARRNPKEIRNLKSLMQRRKKARIFIPIHTINPQLNVLKKYSVRKDYFMEKGEQSELTRLRDDIIFDWLFNRTSFFEIGKKITRIPIIFDMKIADKIYDGNANFEVIPQSFIFEKNKPTPKAIKSFFNQMNHLLYRQGFKINGYCLEKRDSENETIAIDYEKNENSVRLLFNNNFPPLVLKRSIKHGRTVTPFRTEDENNKVHPFSELFMPKEVFDDKKRKRTKYEITIPTEITIPRELWSDYRLMINKYLEGRTKRLEEILEIRNIKNRSNIINLTRV